MLFDDTPTRSRAGPDAFLEDGRIAIDNGSSKREMRMVALGRKNWLFAGSDAGEVRAAGVYSLLGTCRRHGMDPPPLSG